MVIPFVGLCPQCSSTSFFIVLLFYSGIADNVKDCKSGIYFKYLVDNCLNGNYTILINLQLFTPTCIMIAGECFLLDCITSLEVNSFVLTKMIIKMVMILINFYETTLNCLWQRLFYFFIFILDSLRLRSLIDLFIFFLSGRHL